MIVVSTAIGFVLLLWWFATGAILWLDRLDRRTFPWTVAAATLVLAACIFGLAAALVAVAAVTLPGGSLVGLWTFLILWVMRLSARLNIFVGVPTPGLQFLPDHLAYLGGHFRSGPVGAFFAVTTTAATATLAT